MPHAGRGPFFGLRRRRRYRRARCVLRVSSLPEDDTRLAAGEQAGAVLRNLLPAEPAALIAEDAGFVAAEDLRGVGERYVVGAASILDMVVSQNAAAKAKVDVVTARNDYILARVGLEAILGRKM